MTGAMAPNPKPLDSRFRHSGTTKWGRFSRFYNRSATAQPRSAIAQPPLLDAKRANSPATKVANSPQPKGCKFPEPAPAPPTAQQLLSDGSAIAHQKKLSEKYSLSFLFLMVGIVGFEPTTPCSQSRCANQAALYSDLMKKIFKLSSFEDANYTDVFIQRQAFSFNFS